VLSRTASTYPTAWSSPLSKTQSGSHLATATASTSPGAGLQVLLVDFKGDLGEPGPEVDPAGPRYTRSRLAPAGLVALRSEEPELAPIPLGLVNGDTHAGGSRPPFEMR
jgi:hypothetical protein